MRVLVRDIKYLMKAGVLKQPLAGLIFVNLFIYLLSRSNGNGEFVNMEFLWGLINCSFVTAGVVGYIKYWKPMIQEEIDAIELEITNNKKLMRHVKLRKKFEDLG